MTDQNAIVPREEEEELPLGPSPIDAEMVFKEAILIYGPLMEMAIRATRPNNWNNMGGKAYLNDGGCGLVGGICKVSFTDRKTEWMDVSDKDGTYRIFITRGTVSFLGKQIEEEGSAHTRDEFLTHGGKLSSTDPGVMLNCRKKSIANCYGRGVRKILGLKDIPWETLKQHGIDVSTVQRTSFNAGKVISEKQQKLLYARSKDLNLSSDEVKGVIKDIAKVDKSEDIPMAVFNEVLTGIETLASKKPTAPSGTTKPGDFNHQGGK